MKRIFSLLVSFVFILSVFSVQISAATLQMGENAVVKSGSYQQIALSFTPTDSAMDTTRPIVYISDKANKRLYAVNYETGSISSISFSLMPESIYYDNNEVYVSLMTAEHSSYWWPENQTGAIAIIDADTFTLKEQFNISIDPYDIVASNGYLYVTSGSGQWTAIQSYSIDTKTLITSFGIYERANIKLHPNLSKVYTVCTSSSPTDIITYLYNNGTFTSSYDSPYHGDYFMGTNISISPDGKYIFTSTGTVFACDVVKSNDMKYVRTLGMSYNDMAFNLIYNSFYIADSQSITQYRYSDYSKISTIPANGNVRNIFCSEDGTKLVTIYSKTVNSVRTYYVEAVDTSNTPEDSVIGKINNLPGTVTLDDKQTVVEIRKAYDALTAAQKALVTNYDKLVQAEATIATLEAEDIPNYIFDESSGTIFGYNGTGANLSIPSQINGVTVKAIGAFAFGMSATLSSVYIPDTVTEIGEMAFFACGNLASVTLPNTLDKIGDMAYAGCISLASINSPSRVTTLGSGILMGCAFASPVLFESGKTLVFVPQNTSSYSIPSTVTKIGGMAFYMCTNLNYMYIPSSVTTIGDMAFGGCSSLTNITIPSTVTTFGYGILLGTAISSPVTVQSGKTLIYVPQSYTSYTIPNTVTKIGGMAFFMNENLTSVTIPSSVITIDYSAFAYCSALAGITLQSGLTTIGEMAFADCTSLTGINIPSSVKTIGDSAFGGCTALASVNFAGGVATIGKGAFSGCTSVTAIEVPSSVTAIGDGAFEGCSSLTSIIIPNSVTTIGMGILTGTAISTPVIINNGKTLIYVPSSYTDYAIPNGVTRIEGLSFIENSKLTYVTIPSSVTTIGYGAFGYCTSLTEVILPSSVTTLEERAFSNCYSLTKIFIPNSVTSIGDNVFGSCDYLTICGKTGGAAETYAGENSIPFAVVGDDGFAFDAENGTIAGYFGSSSSLVIPAQIGGVNVCAIADYAFENNAVLTSVSIPNTVTKIGTYAFYNCSNLATISIPSTLTDFGYNAFGGTAWLNNYAGDFVIVNEILLNYKGVGGKVTVPSTVKVIGQGAFFGNDTITRVAIPSSVTTIGYGAFGYCTYLSEVVIAEGTTKIEDRAFSDCYSLTRILIPNSVTSIGQYVFDYVSQFTICGNAGSVAELYASKNTLPFATVGNDGFAFNAENGSIAGYFGSSTSLEIPSQIDGVTVKAIGDFAFEYSDITSITIPNTVTKIGRYAFSNCTHLANINFASSVVDFGYSAFENTLWLQNFPSNFVVVNGILIQYKGNESIITIPNNVRVIGDWAFSENTTITKVIIPNGVTTIGVGAFADCTNLSEISVPASVTKISDWAFAGTAWLNNNTDEFVILNGFLLRYNGTATAVTVPDSVKEISIWAFAGCENIISIEIPNTVTKIGTGAFMGCTALEFVNIPLGVKSIDSDMFMDCTSLKAVVIPDSVESISEYAFVDCRDVTIYCKDGSYAESYAEGLGIWFVIIPPPTITIGAYNTQTTNGNITVTASTDDYGTLNATSHTFTENGSFEFIATDAVGNVSRQTVTITNIVKYTKGDINGDGRVDALDLLKLKKNLLGQEGLSAAGSLAADISGDGKVDALDLLQLKKYLLGQISL